jgi:hypothetical protein
MNRFSGLKVVLALLLIVLSVPSFSQCEILNRVYPDGTMLYYMEPVNFYWTSAKSLKGCIVTDKENYFLQLLPVPFPEKQEGKKLKEDLELKLSNGKIYKLKHYDTSYDEKDTVIVMQILYVIQKEELVDFQNFEVEEVTMKMLKDEGNRTYVFKLHKAALKEQLACFLKEQEEKKKK